MKIPFINTTRIVFFLAGAMAFAATIPRACADDTRVFPPNASPYGQSYGQWLAEWWQWSLSFPVTADPENGTADFSASQSGKIWFLPAPLGSGTFVRKGTVPYGKALFTPVLTFEIDDAGSTYTADELADYLQQGWDYVTAISCTIDGGAVRHLRDPQTTPYLCVTPPFSYTLASHDNVIANYEGFASNPDMPDGTTVDLALSGGVCVMIKPLPVGYHTIHITGQLGLLGVTYDVTYQINVTPWQNQGNNGNSCDNDPGDGYFQEHGCK